MLFSSCGKKSEEKDFIIWNFNLYNEEVRRNVQKELKKLCRLITRRIVFAEEFKRSAGSWRLLQKIVELGVERCRYKIESLHALACSFDPVLETQSCIISMARAFKWIALREAWNADCSWCAFHPSYFASTNQRFCPGPSFDDVTNLNRLISTNLIHSTFKTNNSISILISNINLLFYFFFIIKIIKINL